MPVPSRLSRYAGNRSPSSRPRASVHVRSPFPLVSQYSKSSLVCPNASMGATSTQSPSVTMRRTEVPPDGGSRGRRAEARAAPGRPHWARCGSDEWSSGRPRRAGAISAAHWLCLPIGVQPTATTRVLGRVGRVPDAQTRRGSRASCAEPDQGRSQPRCRPARTLVDEALAVNEADTPRPGPGQDPRRPQRLSSKTPLGVGAPRRTPPPDEADQ